MIGFSAKELTVSYGDQTVIRNISFTAESGKLMGILGANGSGKTTLLKAICGILPHSGECILDGKQLKSLSARKIAALCSYIPQRSGISIDISSIDVVLMGFNAHLKLLEYPGAAMTARAEQALKEVALYEKAHFNYQHLSEGQKQMCILARTLVTDSRLLLMDEPESALDFSFRHRMLEIIRRRLQTTGATGIVSLHDPSLALNYCDSLLLIDKGVCSGMIRPRQDALESMEEKLSCIYGDLSLVRCCDKKGKMHILMLKESEDMP